MRLGMSLESTESKLNNNKHKQRPGWWCILEGPWTVISCISAFWGTYTMFDKKPPGNANTESLTWLIK